MNGRGVCQESFINMFDKRVEKKQLAFDATINEIRVSISLEGQEEKIIKIPDEDDKEISDEEILTFRGDFRFKNSEIENYKEFNFDEDETRIELNTDNHNDSILKTLLFRSRRGS